MTIKICINCYHGDTHHTIGMTTYVKCSNVNNKHPDKDTATKYDDGIVVSAIMDLPCWEPKKE
jgi:hypothetical protein